MKIDIIRLVGAVSRGMVARDHNGKPARVVAASRDYDTTVEDLWDALTNPERIPRWFLPISGELRLGGRYQLEGNASGEITKCEPPRHLDVTWEFGDDTSWVEVELGANANGGATLRLAHVSHIPEDDKFWNQYGPGATGVGWEQALWGLELHLQKEGTAISPKDAEAWLTTSDGKQYIAKSSEAWGQAAVSFGTEASIAGAAAHETTKFYTGV